MTTYLIGNKKKGWSRTVQYCTEYVFVSPYFMRHSRKTTSRRFLLLLSADKFRFHSCLSLQIRPKINIYILVYLSTIRIREARYCTHSDANCILPFAKWFRIRGLSSSKSQPDCRSQEKISSLKHKTSTSNKRPLPAGSRQRTSMPASILTCAAG